MDLVWICRNGPNEELRYSIRSATENFDYNNVWVIGGKPSWYRGYSIAVRQNKTKFENALANMNAIVNCLDISEDFILMNDDFFVLEPVRKLESYQGGSLRTKVKHYETIYPNSKYTQLLRKTLDYLVGMGIKNPRDFELHVPFPMKKSKLAPILEWGILWRSAYGNYYNVPSKEVTASKGSSKDVKIYFDNGKLTRVQDNSISKTFLSTEDRAFVRMKEQIATLFPDPTLHEK